MITKINGALKNADVFIGLSVANFINEEMVKEEDLHEGYIVPTPLNKQVSRNVAAAVYKAAQAQLA